MLSSVLWWPLRVTISTIDGFQRKSLAGGKIQQSRVRMGPKKKTVVAAAAAAGQLPSEKQLRSWCSDLEQQQKKDEEEEEDVDDDDDDESEKIQNW